MVTVKRDAQRFMDFLGQIKKRLKSPETVVCDFSTVILITVAHVFSKYVELQDY